MPQGRIQQITQQYRQQLLAREATAVHTLEKAYAHTLATIQPQLDRLYKQIAAKQANGETVTLSWLYEANRLKTIKQTIQKEINQYGALAQMQTGQLQHIGATLGQQSAQAMLQASTPPGVKWSWGVPSQEAIHNIVGVTQAGSPLSDLFNGFGEEAASKASQALITGVSLGQNPRQIAPMIEQALGISRNRALTISRTECLRAYRSMQIANYQANSDVVQGWVWVCAMDSHSCISCIMMNGSEHSLDEDLDGHVNCRCAKSPKTRSWSDILGPDIDTSNIPDSSPQYISGKDWFSSQDEDIQRSVLGSNVAYETWKSGDVSLKSFIGIDHDPAWGRSVYVKSVKQLARSK